MMLPLGYPFRLLDKTAPSARFDHLKVYFVQEIGNTTFAVCERTNGRSHLLLKSTSGASLTFTGGI